MYIKYLPCCRYIPERFLLTKLLLRTLQNVLHIVNLLHETHIVATTWTDCSLFWVHDVYAQDVSACQLLHVMSSCMLTQRCVRICVLTQLHIEQVKTFSIFAVWVLVHIRTLARAHVSITVPFTHLLPNSLHVLQVKIEESFWTLEDRKMIIIHLEKVSLGCFQ